MQKDTKESTQQDDTTIAKEGMADGIIKTSKQQGRIRRKESRKKYINKQCARHRIILWETAMKNQKRVGRLGSVKNKDDSRAAKSTTSLEQCLKIEMIFNTEESIHLIEKWIETKGAFNLGRRGVIGAKFIARVEIFHLI